MAKVGRKLAFDISKQDEILASVEKAMGSLGQVADLNHIPRQTFYGWIRTGDDDVINGVSSELAQFSSSLRKTQAEVIVSLCHRALSDDKASKFIMWFLARVCREDFGVEGIEIKELRDLFKVILPLIGKGDANGNLIRQEVDTESDQA